VSEREHLCASCSSPAQWLICASYADGLAGRLMPYCTDCRDPRIHAITAYVPIALVDRDPEHSLLGIYRAGLTLSDPATFAEMFWPSLSEKWIRAAKREVKHWEARLNG
jgi:hypothetical protein